MKSILLCFSISICILTGCDSNAKVETIEGENEKSVDKSTVKNTLIIDRYCNESYGYCISYPKDVLFPQGESASKDGQLFKSKDSKAFLTVFRDFRDDGGAELSDSDLLKEAFEADSYVGSENSTDKVIVYKKIGDSFFVVSGLENSKVFYQKSILVNSNLITARLDYPETEKELYDKVSELVYKKFK